MPEIEMQCHMEVRTGPFGIFYTAPILYQHNIIWHTNDPGFDNEGVSFSTVGKGGAGGGYLFIDCMC